MEKVILHLTSDDTETNEPTENSDYYQESSDSLFKTWGKNIWEESKSHLSTDGNRDNMQYLPEMSPDILRLICYLPLYTFFNTLFRRRRKN